jgi:two-component system sensor histidine kinase KdpD
MCKHPAITRENSIGRSTHLINNFKNATELGAEVIQKKSDNVAHTIMEIVEEKGITTVCLAKPHLNLFQIMFTDKCI